MKAEPAAEDQSDCYAATRCKIYDDSTAPAVIGADADEAVAEAFAAAGSAGTRLSQRRQLDRPHDRSRSMGQRHLRTGKNEAKLRRPSTAMRQDAGKPPLGGCRTSVRLTTRRRAPTRHAGETSGPGLAGAHGVQTTPRTSSPTLKAPVSQSYGHSTLRRTPFVGKSGGHVPGRLAGEEPLEVRRAALAHSLAGHGDDHPLGEGSRYPTELVPPVRHSPPPGPQPMLRTALHAWGSHATRALANTATRRFKCIQ